MKPVRYRIVDLFIITLWVAILSFAYARPTVSYWIGQPASIGPYRKYGVFATFLTTGVVPGSVVGESFRLHPLSLAIELICVFVVLFLSVCFVRLLQYYRVRKQEIRQIDLLIQNGPDDAIG